MTTRAPTERQTEILRSIASFIARKGYPPTRRKLGALVGITSTNGVTDHLKALECRGLIEIDAGIACGLRITEAGRDLLDREDEDRDGA